MLMYSVMLSLLGALSSTIAVMTDSTNCHLALCARIRIYLMTLPVFLSL